MIITRKHLPRRTFLRGLGTAAIALPVLDAMKPAFAAIGNASAKAPTRLAFVYVPNGIAMDDWTPKGVGKGFELTRILKPLESFREDLFVLSGLQDHNGNALGDGAGDHARAGASFLSGVHCKKTAGADIQAGVSADQIAAQSIGSATRFPSLELGCEDSRTVGNCDSGYSCAYTNSISWRTPTTPMPPEVNPRMAFERLFGTIDLSLDPATRARRLQYRKSILDMVRDDTQKLVGTLGRADRRKIDEYLFAVREIEKRIEIAEKDNHEVLPTIEKPAGIPTTFPEYAKLMYDLQVLAFQADLTRVSTLVVGREGSMRVYPEINVPDPHHPLTHHRNNPEWIEKVKKINCLHTELFAYFLQKLKSTPDGDGTLLDHSMIVYGSGLSDGNRHSHEDLPVLLAGRGDGSLKPGRHIVYKQGTPMTNLYLTLLDRMGVKPEKLGDSTGKVEHLTDL
ncbi:MAG: DUF1552 domain-containing protein [Acidobacteriota bacterium]|nr:DUF1552 domain-containing protein [Acidobacteriota bacterium]